MILLMNGDDLAAWRSMLIAHHRVVGAIEADLATAGEIPLSWYDVLLELNGAPDRRLRMQDLSEQVVLSRSRVSRLVDELEREGLVERLPDPDDGRACLAHLTAEGRDALRRAAPRYLRGIDEHFLCHLDPDERSTIARALQRVIDAHPARRTR